MESTNNNERTNNEPNAETRTITLAPVCARCETEIDRPSQAEMVDGALVHKTHVADVPSIVSADTLRTVDLADSFASTLADIDPCEFARVRALFGECECATDGASFASEECECDDLADYVEALRECLEACAGHYAYFGASEGDGALFGFWPDIDGINDARRYSDALPCDIEGHESDRTWSYTRIDNGALCVEVNDHGNVTLRTVDPNTGEHAQVWAVV